MNNYLRIYLDSTFDLANTLSIKSHFSARVLNRWVDVYHRNTYYEGDPRTWKYYLNLAGEYTSYDERMTVVSMDTLETIEFNKENLRLHRATSRAYQYGTRQYRELVAKYPKNEQLIRGILYPADLEHAVSAPDYSILSYPDYLVEAHETSLIPRLQEWIFSFNDRWNNKQYRISDNLYEATFLGLLHNGTLLSLLAIRLELAKTNEVNTYYIRQYLASHGKLDRFMTTLTRKQQLYLYRNLPWLERNSGRTDAYGDIVDRLLTERIIPLVSYRMVHQVEALTQTLEPEPVFKAFKENAIAYAPVDVSETTERMLLKSDKLANRNPEERIFDAPAIRTSFADSASNRVQTKTLESVMTDYQDMGPYRLSEILTNHWVYLSSVGIYNSYIMIENPKTGSMTPLSAKDAYVFASYLLSHLYRFDLEFIPLFDVDRVQRIIRPTVQEMRSVSQAKDFDDDFVEEAIRYQPSLIPVVSIDAFHEKCREIFMAMKHQYFLVAHTEDFRRRSQVYAITTRLYATKRCRLSDFEGQTYANWFLERNIDINDYLDDNVEDRYLTIVKKATGMDLNSTVSVANIQADMLSIMGQLSSYSIQLLREINTSPIEVLGWPAIRPDEAKADLGGNQGQIKGRVDVLDFTGSMSHSVTRDADDVVNLLALDGSVSSTYQIPLENLTHFNNFDRTDIYRISTAKITVRNLEALPVTEPGIINVPGMAEALLLTNEQRRQLPDTQF